MYRARCSNTLAGEERDTQLFVDHQCKDSHHGSAALVQLDGTLLELGLGIECVPSKVDQVVAEVTNKFVGSGHITHDRGF
jgi:hypothetical protein